MKKGLCIVIGVLIFTLALAGCGGNSSQSSTQKVTEINIWSGDGGNQEFLMAEVEEYNRTTGVQKGIKINLSIYGDSFKNVYELAHSSDQAPELHSVVGNYVALAEKGWVIPVTDLPGGQEFVSNYDLDFIKSSWGMYNNKIYGVPYAVTTYKMVYNKDLFLKAGIADENGNAKAPETWADVINYANTITQQGNGIEYGIALPMKWGAFWKSGCIFPLSSSIGAMYFDQKKGAFNMEAYAPVFTEYLLKIKADKSYFPGPEGLDNDTARAQFAAGKVGMILAASYDVGVYNEQFPAQCDWGVCDVPYLDINNKYMQYASVSLSPVLISNSALRNDPEKVMQVYEWFCGKEMLKKLYKREIIIPAHQDVIESVGISSDKKGFAEFSNYKNAAIALPRPDQVVPEGDTMQDVFMKIWMGILPDVNSALRDLDNRFNMKYTEMIGNGDLNPQDYLFPDYDIRLK